MAEICVSTSQMNVSHVYIYSNSLLIKSFLWRKDRTHGERPLLLKTYPIPAENSDEISFWNLQQKMLRSLGEKETILKI